MRVCHIGKGSQCVSMEELIWKQQVATSQDRKQEILRTGNYPPGLTEMKRFEERRHAIIQGQDYVNPQVSTTDTSTLPILIKRA